VPPEKYQDVMDPFVMLSVAAAVTTSLKAATGICLVVQRDPIQTAKLVASLGHISSGRFLFGLGRDGILRKWEIIARILILGCYCLKIV